MTQDVNPLDLISFGTNGRVSESIFISKVDGLNFDYLTCPICNIYQVRVDKVYCSYECHNENTERTRTRIEVGKDIHAFTSEDKSFNWISYERSRIRKEQKKLKSLKKRGILKISLKELRIRLVGLDEQFNALWRLTA